MTMQRQQTTVDMTQPGIKLVSIYQQHLTCYMMQADASQAGKMQEQKLIDVTLSFHLQTPQVLNTRPHQRPPRAALSSRVRSQCPVQVKQQYRPHVLTDVFIYKV